MAPKKDTPEAHPDTTTEPISQILEDEFAKLTDMETDALEQELTRTKINQGMVDSFIAPDPEPDLSIAMLEQGRLYTVWTKFNRCFKSHETSDNNTSAADCPQCLSYLKEMAEVYQCVFDEIETAFLDFQSEVPEPVEPAVAHALHPDAPETVEWFLSFDNARYERCQECLDSLEKLLEGYRKRKDEAVKQYEDWAKAKTDSQGEGTGDTPSKDQEDGKAPEVSKKRSKRKRKGNRGKR